MNLAAAGHRHLWPLAAANSWCFTNNLVDKATADANFSGFHDYEDFMGLEGSSGQCSDLSGKRRVSQGMEFAQIVTMPIEPRFNLLLQNQQRLHRNPGTMVPAPTTLPRLRRRQSRVARPKLALGRVRRCALRLNSRRHA